MAADALVLQHQGISSHNADLLNIVLNQFHECGYFLKWTNPSRFGKNLKHSLENILVKNVLSIFSQNGPNRGAQNLFDDRSTLLHCCLVAQIQYLSQCWPSFKLLNGINWGKMNQMHPDLYALKLLALHIYFTSDLLFSTCTILNTCNADVSCRNQGIKKRNSALQMMMYNQVFIWT